MTATIEFPKKLTILGNIALVAWIAVAAIGFILINIAAGVLFLFVALIAIYGILKFLGCLRPCYNCKKCTFGMGRLAALYFGGRNLKDYKETYRLPVAIFYYALIGPLPVAVVLAYTVAGFTLPKMAVSICLIAFSLFSGLTWHRRALLKLDLMK